MIRPTAVQTSLLPHHPQTVLTFLLDTRDCDNMGSYSLLLAMSLPDDLYNCAGKKLTLHLWYMHRSLCAAPGS